jgi:hypothetical protein
VFLACELEGEEEEEDGGERDWMLGGGEIRTVREGGN